MFQVHVWIGGGIVRGEYHRYFDKSYTL